MQESHWRSFAILVLWGADVTAFFPTSTRPQSCRDVIPSSIIERQRLFLGQTSCSRPLSQLHQASIVEDTLHDFSADSHDEEPDELDDNGVATNDEIQITDLSGIVKPQKDSKSRGNKHYRNHHNPAMADASFLRKRTANLLKATSPDHADKELRALGGNMKIGKKTFHFLLDAWAFSGEADAVQQATRLVERMEELKYGDHSMSPDVRSYTKLINAISRTGEQDAGERAEEILHKMRMLAETEGDEAVRPNTYTYTAVIEAHANSGAPGSTERALELCEIMVDRYIEGSEDVTPTSRAFQAALVAYTKSEEVGSAESAENLFDRMEELYHSGIEEMKPTAVNLNTLISAWANCRDEGSAQRAEEVLRRMEYLYRNGDEDLKPTTVSFNAVIDAYAKSGEDGAAEKAEEILKRMEELYETGENLDAKPDVRSFNSVINAWAKSRDQDNALRAQEILDFMEKLYEDGDTSIGPDVLSFSTVINGMFLRQFPGSPLFLIEYRFLTQFVSSPLLQHGREVMLVGRQTVLSTCSVKWRRCTRQEMKSSDLRSCHITQS